MTDTQKSFATALIIDNPSLKGREDKYITLEVDLAKIIESWRLSIFSFEWLTPEGHVRTPSTLNEQERGKYNQVIENLEAGIALERPILGIGMMDNVEIGARRDVLLTLYAKGEKRLSVHIPKSVQQDFTPYL